MHACTHACMRCNKVSMGDVYWRREQWAKEPLAKRPPGMLIHRVQE